LGVLETQETFCIVIAGLLERDNFDLFLPEFDKPWVIHLRETCCCSTNLCTWRPNTVHKNRCMRRHHRAAAPPRTRSGEWHAGQARTPPPAPAPAHKNLDRALRKPTARTGATTTTRPTPRRGQRARDHPCRREPGRLPRAERRPAPPPANVATLEACHARRPAVTVPGA
jgi:hypothetical protein